MKMPQEVLDAAQKAALDHGGDIEAAVNQAEQEIRAMPEFDDLISSLIQDAIRGLVYNARHAANVQMKRDVGYYARVGIPKVVPAESEAVGRAFRSVYDYFIGGTQLGLLCGKDLRKIAEMERSVSDGHLFNARLCETLAARVPTSKPVREVISEGELQSIFAQVRKEVGKAA